MTFRYWTSSYSTNLADKASCRLIVQIDGITYHLFNRTDHYDSLRDILKGMFFPGLIDSIIFAGVAINVIYFGFRQFFYAEKVVVIIFLFFNFFFVRRG